MRTKEQMQARVDELNEIVNQFEQTIKKAEKSEDVIALVSVVNDLCKERDIIRWCLDETRYPHPTDTVSPEST